MTKSIDEAIGKIIGLNLDVSEEEKMRQSAGGSLHHQVQEKMDEVISGFLVFLPHLKNQIDFAYAHGKKFYGAMRQAKGKDGELLLSAYGSKVERSFLFWKGDYHLRIYFAFSNALSRKYLDLDRCFPTIEFAIPADPKKDRKTQVALYLESLYSPPFMEVQLMQLADVVVKGYQEGSDLGKQVFSEYFSYSDVAQYKMLLPWVLSAIPELTVDAAGRLNSSIRNRKEAATGNSDNIGKLKAPDLEEAIGLLDRKR